MEVSHVQPDCYCADDLERDLHDSLWEEIEEVEPDEDEPDEEEE